MSLFRKTLIAVLLLLIALPAVACFGPKLYVGTPAGEDGELLFRLVTIYLKEKTGVESVRVEFADGQSAASLLAEKKIDFGFSSSPDPDWPHLLAVEGELYLLHGTRPVEGLQFTTVPKALKRLQNKLQAQDLSALRKQVAAGVLPASAVRALFDRRGWL